MIMHGSGKSGMSGGMNAGGVACAISCCVCCWYMPVMTFTDIEKVSMELQCHVYSA